MLRGRANQIEIKQTEAVTRISFVACGCMGGSRIFIRGMADTNRPPKYMLIKFILS